MEISLLLLVVVLIFGIGPSTRMLGKIFDTYRKVNDAKQQLSGTFSPRSFLQKANPKDSPAPPANKTRE